MVSACTHRAFEISNQADEQLSKLFKIRSKTDQFSKGEHSESILGVTGLQFEVRNAFERYSSGVPAFGNSESKWPDGTFMMKLSSDE